MEKYQIQILSWKNHERLGPKMQVHKKQRWYIWQFFNKFLLLQRSKFIHVLPKEIREKMYCIKTKLDNFLKTLPD